MHRENCRMNSKGEWTTKNGEKLAPSFPVICLVYAADGGRSVKLRSATDCYDRRAAQAIGANFSSRERLANAEPWAKSAFFELLSSKIAEPDVMRGWLFAAMKSGHKSYALQRNGMEPRYFHTSLEVFRWTKTAQYSRLNFNIWKSGPPAGAAAADFYSSEFVRVGWD